MSSATDAAESHEIFASFRWKNTLLIPLIATLISGVLLFVQVVLRVWSRSRRVRSSNLLKPIEVSNEDEATHTTVGKLKKFSISQGGLVIFAFSVARFLCCLSLFSLSLVGIVIQKRAHRDLEWGGIFRGANLQQFSVAITFVRGRASLVQL
jgi:hypothetical protein